MKNQSMAINQSLIDIGIEYSIDTNNIFYTAYRRVCTVNWCKPT